jgi:hypothetical protein
MGTEIYVLGFVYSRGNFTEIKLIFIRPVTIIFINND